MQAETTSRILKPLRAAISAALLVAATATTPASVRTEYWLISGPDYRQVGAHEFDEFRSSCMKIERRSYPDHVVQWHCYL